MVAAITQDRLESLEMGLEKSIINIGSSSTPAFNKFKVMQKSMPTKVVWLRKILSRMRDQLNGSVNSSVTTFTVDGSTSTSPVKYWPGYMAALIDTEWVTIDGQPSSTTITVTRGAFGSTAAAHSDNAYVYLVPINAIGAARIGKDDSQFSGRDYNLIQNYHDEIPVANLLEEGRMPSFADVNEASPEEQRKNLLFRARQIVERSFWYGRRYNQGGAAASTAGVTFTADGGKNMTGGLHYFIGQHSGFVPTSSSAPPTITDIQTDLRNMRDVGSFEGLEDVSYDGDATAMLACSLLTFSKINQLPWAQGNFQIQGKDLTYGVSTRKLYIDGIIVEIVGTNEIQDGHYFLIPTKKDRFKIKLQRLAEKQPVNNDGDQKVCIYSTTWANHIGDGRTATFRSDLARS